MSSEAQLEQKSIHSSDLAWEFLQKYDYNSFSSEEVMERVFIVALGKFLNNDQESLWVLGKIGNEFEANPAIHLSNYKKQIYNAIDLTYYLFQNKKTEIAKNVALLKLFYNSLDIKGI